MKKVLAFFSLFGSLSTLVCCALPALFVVLGMGAAFAGIVSAFPELIWLSENKTILFLISGVLLAASGVLQYYSRPAACPIDPQTGAACRETKSWSRYVYFVSLGIYLCGAFFAFVIPYLL